MDLARALDALVPQAYYGGALSYGEGQAYATAQEAYDDTASRWGEGAPDPVAWVAANPRPSLSAIQAKWEELDLADARQARKAEIQAHHDTLARTGALYNTKRYGFFELRDQINYLTLYLKALSIQNGNNLTWDATTFYVANDNTKTTLATYQDAMALVEAILAVGESLLKTKIAHDDAVDAIEVLDGQNNPDYAATKAAILAYDFINTAPTWPS